MKDLSGKSFATWESKQFEPKNCIGKHWIPGYVRLGETCHYCQWTKKPISEEALRNAQLQYWNERVNRASEALQEALAGLEAWE